MKITILSALALVALATTSMQADDDSMQTRMLNAVVPGLVDLDFKIRNTELTPILEQGALHIFTIPTYPGEQVALVAVGDWDANDVDLFVQHEDSDSIVSRDVFTDNTPVCEFTAKGGTYVVTVRMVDADRPAYVRVIFASK